MFIYRKKETKEIVYKESRDEKLDNSDEWEFITEYKNAQYKKIIKK